MEYPRLWVAFEPGCDVPSNQNGGIPSLRRNIMKEIELTKGYKAQVDDEDYESVMKHKWQVRVSKTKNTFRAYAVRSVMLAVNVKGTVFMHREILGTTDKKIKTDHRDHNGLNNQKSNLRKCTSSENSFNIPSKIGSTSKYVGVSYANDHLRRKRWLSKIRLGNKDKCLGIFLTEYEAALARDRYIIDNNLEFPTLNILTRP